MLYILFVEMTVIPKNLNNLEPFFSLIFHSKAELIFLFQIRMIKSYKDTCFDFTIAFDYNKILKSYEKFLLLQVERIFLI